MTALVERSTQILCMLDFQGTIRWCNDSMTRVLRYGPGELIGVNVGTLVHPEDMDVMWGTESILATGDEISGVQARSRCKDGSWRTLDWTVWADTERRLIYSAARDVTEYREADESLRDDEARLRAILEYSPSSIYVKDLQGRYLIVNKQWSRVTGIPVEDVMGATATETWPADADAIAEHERLLLESGAPQVSDDRMLTRSGKRDFQGVALPAPQ